MLDQKYAGWSSIKRIFSVEVPIGQKKQDFKSIRPYEANFYK